MLVTETCLFCSFVVYQLPYMPVCGHVTAAMWSRNNKLLAECFVLFIAKSFCQVQKYVSFSSRLVVCSLYGYFVRSFLLSIEWSSCFQENFQKGNIQEILVLTVRLKAESKICSQCIFKLWFFEVFHITVSPKRFADEGLLRLKTFLLQFERHMRNNLMSIRYFQFLFALLLLLS